MSKKSVYFSSTPMGDKGVKDIPGIGEASAEKLREAGYTKAHMVLKKYVDCGRNEAEFLDWLNKEVKVGQQYARSCVDALKEWCNQYMPDEDEAERLKIRIEKAKGAVKEAQVDLKRAEADLAGLEEKFGKLAV